MEPTIMDGDKIIWAEFLDSHVGSNPINDGRVYVLTIEGAYRVKRLSRVKAGIRISSDNQHYDDEIYTGSECDSIRIFGPVLQITREGF